MKSDSRVVVNPAGPKPDDLRKVPDRATVTFVMAGIRPDEQKPLAQREIARIVDAKGLEKELSANPVHLPLRVSDPAAPESEHVVRLEFRSMDDFGPGSVARQIPPTKELLALRARLQELLWQTQQDGPAVAGLLDEARTVVERSAAK